MFRGKIKGRKGNDQDGVGRKKVRNAVNLKVCKDSEQTRENSMLPHYTDRESFCCITYKFLMFVSSFGDRFSVCDPS